MSILSSADHIRTPGDYGEDYSNWKKWPAETWGDLTKRKEGDFSAQIRKSKTTFPPQSRVLEIGFGNGSFLAYGAKRRWDMQGTEINTGLIQRATQKGYGVCQTANLEPFPDNHFDLVCAFDVLEHLKQDDLPRFLMDIKKKLKCGGICIARFPNGDSPFSRFLQHGDPTHMTTIGSSMARYLALQLGVEVVYLGAEIMTLRTDLSAFIYRLTVVPIRKLMNIILNVLFTPHDYKEFCSPNLIWIFRARRADQDC